MKTISKIPRPCVKACENFFYNFFAKKSRSQKYFLILQTKTKDVYEYTYIVLYKNRDLFQIKNVLTLLYKRNAFFLRRGFTVCVCESVCVCCIIAREPKTVICLRQKEKDEKLLLNVFIHKFRANRRPVHSSYLMGLYDCVDCVVISL